MNPLIKRNYTKMEETLMSTTMMKAAEVSRKWYIIDAAGESLGRTAAKAAALLRGKHKVDFTPNVDCGDQKSLIVFSACI